MAPTIRLLCEDKHQRDFVVRALQKANISTRGLFPNVSPQGKGSGKDYVDNTYPNEVANRRTCPHITLIVVTDADDGTVQERRKQLEECLQSKTKDDGGKSKMRFRPLEKEDKVFFLIPKWEIENWVYYLWKGEEVAESRAYSKKELPAVKYYDALRAKTTQENLGKFIADIRQNTQTLQNCPESLCEHGKEELKRIF